jgi:hypothetical protein
MPGIMQRDKKCVYMFILNIGNVPISKKLPLLNIGTWSSELAIECEAHDLAL